MSMILLKDKTHFLLNAIKKDLNLRHTDKKITIDTIVKQALLNWKKEGFKFVSTKQYD